MTSTFTSILRSKAYGAATLAYGRLCLGNSPRQGLRILMYHSVGTPVEGDVRRLYNIPFALFQKHMYCLAKNYADNLVAVNSSMLDDNSLRVALSFDDGYQNNLSLVAPLLVELDIPFTIFIFTGAVAERKPGFLCPEEVCELARLPNVSIGSHSINHLRLTEICNQKLNKELVGSKAYLEDLLGKEVNLLSYPHGAVNQRVRDVAEDIGYRTGATSRFDINLSTRDPLLLSRSDIWAADNITVFEQKIRGDWDWNRWRETDPAQTKRINP